MGIRDRRPGLLPGLEILDAAGDPVEERVDHRRGERGRERAPHHERAEHDRRGQHVGGQLVQQIAHGAPFDVFASANAKQMDLAMTTGRIDSASVKIFARNHLVVVVPRDNPARISSLVDLAQANLKIVLADKSVPAGQYAVDVLGKCAKSAGFPSAFKEAVIRNVVSYEENVKAVLSKIVLGEADAGIVYASDISRDSTHRVGQIVIPDSLNVIAEYPVAAAGETGASAAAKEFVGYVCSGKGQKILRLFGFSEPKE